MGLSLLATITTSATFIVYLGTAYAGDWSLLIPGIMFVFYAWASICSSAPTISFA
jgi:hypothetical protein